MAIERPEQMDRVLSSSDVDICLDTGHLYLGGIDPVELGLECVGPVGVGPVGAGVVLVLVAAGRRPGGDCIALGETFQDHGVGGAVVLVESAVMLGVGHALPEPLAAVVEKVGQRCLIVKANVAKEADVKAMFSQIDSLKHTAATLMAEIEGIKDEEEPEEPENMN